MTFIYIILQFYNVQLSCKDRNLQLSRPESSESSKRSTSMWGNETWPFFDSTESAFVEMDPLPKVCPPPTPPSPARGRKGPVSMPGGHRGQRQLKFSTSTRLSGWGELILVWLNPNSFLSSGIGIAVLIFKFKLQLDHIFLYVSLMFNLDLWTSDSFPYLGRESV